MQEVVDDMSLAGCSNLNAWVRALDERVEGVLAKRLEKVCVSVYVCVFVCVSVCAVWVSLVVSLV